MTGLQLGPFTLAAPVVLAPMAGVTNAPFRKLCRDFALAALGNSPDPLGDVLTPGVPLPPAQQPAPDGTYRAPAKVGETPVPGLFVTEMITSRALVERTSETMRMIMPDPAEQVRSVQLYGVDPQVMGQAAAILVGEGWADHIDLNFGCPVPKVTKKGGGAALPWKYDLFAAIVEAVSENAGGVPVTVKIRLGIDDTHETYLHVSKLAQQAGAAAVTLHARTLSQYYSGKAQWDKIAWLRQSLHIPVLGNGDVFEAEDAAAMMSQTGCQGVVVGRGCQGRPWLFYDLVSHFMGSDRRFRPTLGQVAQVILWHTHLMTQHFGGDELRALREMRKHIGWYLRGYPVGGRQRGPLNLVSSTAELEERLHQLPLDAPCPPAARGPRGRAGTQKAPHLPEGWLETHELSDKWKAQLHLAEQDTSGG